MRYLQRPGARRGSAALAATGCLLLTACGGSAGKGSAGSQHPPATPSGTAAATTEPASGPGAVAAIEANWKTVFNGEAPLPRRLALLQDGSEVAAFVEAQAKTSLGAAAAGSTAKVFSVAITAPAHATVKYEVLLLGTPLLKNQAGTAVLVNGVWQVGIASFCGLAHLAYSGKSKKLPAICRS